MSEKILRKIIIKLLFFLFLLYGVDPLSLDVDQVHNLSVASNVAITRCFHMARKVSVCGLLYFVGSRPVNMMLDERKVNLVKSCLNSNEEKSLCARIR